jgi:hypothetical protein
MSDGSPRTSKSIGSRFYAIPARRRPPNLTSAARAAPPIGPARTSSAPASHRWAAALDSGFFARLRLHVVVWAVAANGLPVAARALLGIATRDVVLPSENRAVMARSRWPRLCFLTVAYSSILPVLEVVFRDRLSSFDTLGPPSHYFDAIVNDSLVCHPLSSTPESTGGAAKLGPTAARTPRSQPPVRPTPSGPCARRASAR